MDVAYSTGGVCSGGGVLVNSSLTDFRLLCQCDDMRNGRGDFFDTTVGEFSLSCSNLRPVEITAWSLVLFGMLRRFYSVARLFAEKYEAKRASSQLSWRKVFENFVLRVLLFDMAMVTPVMTAVCCLKIAGQTIGTNVAVTLLYILAIILFQYGTGVMSNREFKILTAFLPPQERDSLRGLHDKMQTAALVIYSLGVGGPSIAALALNRQSVVGPLDNGEFVALLVRNALVMAWAICSLATSRLVYKRFVGILGSMQDSKANEALVRMRAANRLLLRLYFFVIIIMAAFCIPQLWAYQTYAIAGMILLGTRRHPAQSFPSTWGAKGTTSNSGANETKPNQVLSALSGQERGSSLFPASTAV